MRPASGTQKFLEILIFRLFKEDRPLQKQGLTVDSFLSGFYNLNTNLGDHYYIRREHNK